MLPWDLEDWLTDEGDRLVSRVAAGMPLRTDIEHAIYEIWLLDTEARNGGLSQYFYNRGASQWERCVVAVQRIGLDKFVPFAAAVNALIEDASEPGDAIRVSERDGDDAWSKHQVEVVSQLRALAGAA